MKLLKEIILLLEDIRRLLRDIKLVSIRGTIMDYDYGFYDPKQEMYFYKEPDTTFGDD